MHIGLETWYVVILIQIVGAVGRFVTRTIYNGFVRKGNVTKLHSVSDQLPDHTTLDGMLDEVDGLSRQDSTR